MLTNLLGNDHSIFSLDIILKTIQVDSGLVNGLSESIL